MCDRWQSHIFGGGGVRNGVTTPYYVCSKRFNYHECEQDYVRSDLLDSAAIEDVMAIFRDEQFMARLWEEANKRLCAEKPILEQEIEKIDAEVAKTRAATNRHFKAFEAGELEASLCNEKVRDLGARLAELEAEVLDLEARQGKLEIPPIDHQMLRDLTDNFEKVMAGGTNPQKKDLLRRVVKKVLVHDRRTLEIWYALPNRRGIEHSNIWLPR